MRFLILVAFLVSISMAPADLRYVRSDDSKVLLRRDLLPLDVDGIKELARHLVVLADGPFPDSVALIRHRARALTLSQRLDPDEKTARIIERALLERKNRPAPAESARKHSLEAILETANWLTELPENSEGFQLGQLLLDIAQTPASDHHLVRSRMTGDPSKRWNQTIADLEAFESEREAETPEKPEPPASGPQTYALTALLTEVPMVSSPSTSTAPKPTAGLVNTSLVITRTSFIPQTPETAPKRAPGKLIFKPGTSEDIPSPHTFLLEFFESRSTPLPTGYNLNINTTERQYLSQNRDNINASIAMLLDSALTGRSLRRDTILLARLLPDGRLGKPAAAWEILLALEESNRPEKTRLIVGTGLLDELTGLLVLEMTSFFNRFEVLEAASFAEARTLYFEDGEMPEPLQLASKGYQEVREKADQANHLGSFLSLPSVEDRLVKASVNSPKHLSAKMLAQHAIRRPALFTRTMAARDLDRRLAYLARSLGSKSSDDEIKRVYKETRDRLSPLERLLQMKDKKLLVDAITMLRKSSSIGRRAAATPQKTEELRQEDLRNFLKEVQKYRQMLRGIHSPAPAPEQ